MLANQAYTKHYYIGGERVCSKLGGGMANNELDPLNSTIDPVAFKQDYQQLGGEVASLVSRSVECASGGGMQSVTFDPYLRLLEGNDDPENELYFYHTDHLGSSSWITVRQAHCNADATGSAYQHIQSLPFGEQFIEQRQSSWDAMYKFTGKPACRRGRERDMETGLDYFGARYLAHRQAGYDSDLSIWLSRKLSGVDPLASKFPGISGYAYVINNPVNLRDKYGLEPEERKPIEYEPNKYSRRYNRKYKHWIEKNRDNLVDVPNVEFTDLFLHSKNAFGKEVINSRWYKKYKNHVETSNSTGWRNKITAPEQDNCLNSVSDLSHGNVNTVIDFNANEGSLYISYDMFSVADRIQLYDESNGNIIYDSQYVTGKDSQVVKFQLSSGNTEIRLVINEGKKPSNTTAFKYKIGLINGELKITTSTKIETTKKPQ